MVLIVLDRLYYEEFPTETMNGLIVVLDTPRIDKKIERRLPSNSFARFSQTLKPEWSQNSFSQEKFCLKTEKYLKVFPRFADQYRGFE